MPGRRAFLYTVVVCLAVLSRTVLVAADPQGTPATLAGQVTDDTGGVLPGATLRIIEAETSRERTVVTDGRGRFSVSPLRPGTYTVITSLSGFESATSERVVVSDGRRVELGVTLHLSTMKTSVTVRGTAQNYASSVAGKRMADGVVDMFNADELGRLPDKNIGETLNRIPGVSMLLEKGEGRFVQIRGISPRLNNVTINGLALGNGETESGGRLAPLDVVGGELLGGVQVLKTPTPDMDGQGIGGTLNLTTKQPFDFRDRFTVLFSTRSGFESIDAISPADTKETPYAMDATLAGKFAAGKVGWLAGSSFSNRMTPLLGIFNDTWRPVSFGGQTINLPTNVKNNVTVTARERLNVNTALEFRPNAASTFFVRSFLARWDELQLRNRFDEGLGDFLTGLNGRVGTVATDRVQVNLRSEPTVKRLLSFTAGGARQAGAWHVDFSAQRHHNTVDEPNDNWEFRSGAATFGPDTFEVLDSGVVTISSPGRDRQDPSFQTFRRVRFFKQLTEERGTVGVFNLRRDFSLGARLPAFVKVGGKFTQTSRSTAVSQANFGIGSLNWTAAQVPTLTRGGFANPVPLLGVPNLWLDFDGLSAFFAANRDDARFFRLDQADTYLNEYQSDFTLRERVGAGYAMTKLDFGAWNLITGVRVETTDVRSSAFTMVTRGTQLVAEPADGKGSYATALPSVIGTFNLRQDLIARAAFTTSVGRPEFDAIAPRSRLGIEDNPTLGTIGSLSIGNPDLKARQSKNYDGSLEWYFNEGALASVAGFYKDITNEIIPAPTQQFTNYTFLGQTFNRFDINTTINAQSAFVGGVEFTIADRLTFLPRPLQGFGVAGSLTLIKSGIEVARGTEVLTLPLLQQAGRSASGTLYHQRGRWDVSVTYKYNANFLTNYGASRALDLDQGSFGRVDCRAQFDLTPRIKVNISGINLNNRPTTEFQGGDKRQVTEYEYTGRTFFFGLSARVGR